MNDKIKTCLKLNKNGDEIIGVKFWDDLSERLIEGTDWKKINGVITDKNNNVIKTDDLRYMIKKQIRNLSPKLTSMIAQNINDNIKNENEAINDSVIRFENGFFDVKKGYFMGFLVTGDKKAINTIPWEYDLEWEDKPPTSELGEELLRRYEGDNKGFTTQFFEAVGLMMVQDKDFGFKKTIFFNGPADYGKSLLFNEIVRPAIGDHNVGLFSMADLSSKELASFVHKTCVYDDDMDKGQMTPSVVSKFKKITGSSRLKAKLLYKDEFEFVNYATAWVNCNGLPEISDRGSGGSILTRMHVLQATVDVKSKFRDPLIIDKIKAKREEISKWVIYNAVHALHKAYLRGHLTETTTSKDILMDDEFSRDTVVRFLGSKGWDGKPISATGLFKLYKDSFEEPTHNMEEDTNLNYGYTALGQRSFGIGMGDHLKKYEIIKRRTNKGVTYEWPKRIKGDI